MATSTLRSFLSPGTLLRIALTAGACVGIWMAIDAFIIQDRTQLTVDWLPWLDKPVDLLAPQWLHLFAIVPIFYLLRVLSLTDLSTTQQVFQSTLRSLVVAGFAIALARPTWITQTSKVSTIVLIDVSDSVSDKQLEAAKKYVDDLEESEKDGNLQLVTFAEKPLVVRKEEGTPLSHGIKRHVGAGAGTDVQSAMQLGYGLYPDGYLPRMVMVTDGNQTAGDLAVEAYRAKELGVKVSWKTFDADKTAEIRVVGVTVPDDLKVGQPYEVTAEVWSSIPQRVTLTLQQDEFPNPLEPSKSLELREGKNLIKFKSDAKHAGATTYTLRLAKYEKDTEKANNAAVMTAPVKGKPSVLYVEGGILREPGSASYLQRALETENIDVSVRGPTGIPSNPKELEKYDLVLVSDVPAHLMGAGQMAALDAYVKAGGGLLMAGGEDSFGSGGYERTMIESMMPVRFDSEKIKEQPDIALALVIDRSGSMQGQKLEMAKESARVTTEVLSPNDYITVIAFDSEAQMYVPPTRASNRMRISNDIARLNAGGGTNIYPGLKMAYEQLSGINAKVKHVILMTDGEAPTDGLAELVGEMRQAKITVSSVGVPGADRNMLAMIADAGEGRLYMVEDIGALPKIFMKETQEAQKSQLIEDLIHVVVAKQVEAIEGTNVENAPVLHGYVSTKPKTNSETILIASGTGEPVLSRWRWGAGNSVAWTSDVKNRWSVDWIRWGGYPKFWAQVVRSSMRRKVYDSYDLFAKVADGRAMVTVDAIDTGDKFVNELDTELQVINPANNQVIQTVSMEQTAAGRYTSDFKITKYGSYLLKAIHKRDGKTVAESLGSVALSYPLEYLRTTPDYEPLKHAAQVSGGHDQAKVDQVWDPGTESVDYTQDLWPFVLIGVVGLFLLDLYSKRVRLFGYRTIKFS